MLFVDYVFDLLENGTIIMDKELKAEKLGIKNGDKYIVNVTWDGRIVFQKVQDGLVAQYPLGSSQRRFRQLQIHHVQKSRSLPVHFFAVKGGYQSNVNWVRVPGIAGSLHVDHLLFTLVELGTDFPNSFEFHQLSTGAALPVGSHILHIKGATAAEFVEGINKPESVLQYHRGRISGGTDAYERTRKSPWSLDQGLECVQL